MTEWRAEYLQTGGPGPWQWDDWYATRHTKQPIPPGYGMMCTFAGPFRTESEARAWADAENAKGADTPHIVAGSRPQVR